jgi:hypothetical protein
VTVAEEPEIRAKRPSAPETAVLLFDTTHAAMAAEDIIVGGGFWCDVVPRPPDAMSGLCGLAIEVLTADLPEIRDALGAGGIAFEIYQPEVEAH